MPNPILDFYDSLAAHYHLIFEDWDASIERQSSTLNNLLTSHFGSRALRILDCACGIGTQALGLAARGHQVVGSDLSSQAIERARREAKARKLDIEFYVADMTDLTEFASSGFDVVAALDNALPHLSPVALERAVRAMRDRLHPGGLILASIRDYDVLILERPIVQGPAFYGDKHGRRIIQQVWDWIDHDRYIMHLYITIHAAEGWTSHHFVSEYRCLLRDELAAALQSNGFEEVRWLMPTETGFYQPLVLARKSE
jgi:glycine/sarcosine N-methyltransferase